MSDLLERLKAKDVPAGEYKLASGVTIYLRRLTVADKLRVLNVSKDRERPWPLRQAEFLALLMCDASNARLFGDNDTGEFDRGVMELALGADADRIVEAGFDANGFGGGDEKKTPSPATPKS